MLTSFRNMLRSKYAGILFALLIVSMAAWGVTDVFSGGLGSNIAASGSQTLSQQALDSAVERTLRTEQNAQGQALSKSEALEQGTVDRVISQEIARLTLSAYGERLGAVASADRVYEIVSEDPEFADTTGRFSSGVYRSKLSQAGFTPQTYEALVRRDVTISNLLDIVDSGLRVPTALSDLQTEFFNQRRSAAWFELTPDMAGSPEAPDEDELRTLYEEQAQSLEIPERRQVSMIEFTADDLMNTIEFSEAEIEAYYESIRAREYAEPATRRFSEYIFETEAAADAAYPRLAGGADPAQLDGFIEARERSGGASSVTNAQMRAAVFNPGASVGSLAGPFNVQGVWLISELQEIIPGESPPLEEVRDEVLDTLRRDQASGALYESMQRIDNLIGTGAGLKEIADDIGAPVLTYAPVTASGRTGEGRRFPVFAQNPAVLERAFTLQEGEQSRRIETRGDAIYLIRVDRILEPVTPAFEDVRERLAQQTELQRLAEALQTEAQSASEAIADTSIETVAEQYGAELGRVDGLTRLTQQTDLPQSMIEPLFDAAAAGDVLVGRGQDGLIVMEVTSIENPDGDSANPQLASQIRDQLRQQFNADLRFAYLNSIQQTVEADVNDAALAAYKERISAQ